jgi:hypothetical protein
MVESPRHETKAPDHHLRVMLSTFACPLCASHPAYAPTLHRPGADFHSRINSWVVTNSITAK